MTDTDVTCSNRQCRVGEDRKCLEGYEEFSRCPYYGRELGEEAEYASIPDERPKDTFDGIRLRDAFALEAPCANRVLTILPSRMIGVIGAYDSGKTSIIAGLYDLFQNGPVSGAIFAGSSTLHGLELICHDARVASDREEAHSERTKRGEVQFYHVDVRQDGELRTILIADRSGEEYEEVADLAANASAMFELRRADVITILVDGLRLESPVERADTIGAIPLILQGMVENYAFARRPNVAIVLTKDDVVQASARKERVMKDFQAIVENIRNSFGNSFGEIASFVTCASPKNATAERGRGLAALLSFWIKPNPVPQGTRLDFSSGRVFDRLVVEGTDGD
ncbi:TRAFAC clade GTPase domain-containing protein [Burkholderia gladioli]|uniref:TRAFAC clade GTPase domain-containing protein n=1 Tax=Burkholderia gladioli TaxID=28095 RepID=UPI00164069FC|nr:hypothetical protein [Burkholderia gladioli]MBJ9678980.1 hypothetical protein [Burkholderia gladioli]MDN7742284.1 hypothetical protein [Burkholderia gladioli]